MPQYPDRIEFDIDRKRLTRYWRAQSAVVLSILGAFCYGFSCLFVLANFQDNPDNLPAAEIAALTITRLGTGALVALGLTALAYLGLAHFQVRGRALRLRLLVEGPYLRIIMGGGLFRRDRRIHFRAISDYSTIDGPLLGRFGLRALSFTVIGVAQHQILTTVPGILDTQKVRDDLCAIDAMREGPQTSV